MFKLGFAASIIALCSWLSGKKPEMAGFITALPLVSIMALAFSFVEHKDVETTTRYAQSILIAVPISYLFFVPFFFTKTTGLGFWPSWGLGLVLLTIGYFLHQWILKQF